MSLSRGVVPMELRATKGPAKEDASLLRPDVVTPDILEAMCPALSKQLQGLISTDTSKR